MTVFNQSLINDNNISTCLREKYNYVVPVLTSYTVFMNSAGWFEFRLCANNDTGRAVTQACLDQHLLLMADGMGARYYVIEDAPRKYVIPLRLPPALTCSQCVLQWKYNAGKSICRDVRLQILR